MVIPACTAQLVDSKFQKLSADINGLLPCLPNPAKPQPRTVESRSTLQLDATRSGSALARKQQRGRQLSLSSLSPSPIKHLLVALQVVKVSLRLPLVLLGRSAQPEVSGHSSGFR